MKLPVLEFLRGVVRGDGGGDKLNFNYPTAISNTLGFRIVAVGEGEAVLEVDADPKLHGNQQGTVHGGFLAELGDAAIGTAHSTLMQAGESFTGIDLRCSFFRPCWKTKLRATAKPIQSGKTITHYECEITRADGKVAARVWSTLMTLRGERARGR